MVDWRIRLTIFQCNEVQPQCAGCAKRSIPCQYQGMIGPRDSGVSTPTSRPDWVVSPSYPGGTPQVHGIAPSDSSDPAVPSQALPDVGRPPTPSTVSTGIGHFTMDDMVLWHHFATVTAATIAGPWEKELPLQALNCDFLMHGLLATAALHLAYLHPERRDRFNYQSAHHQDLALGPFRHVISEINLENCHQVFAFSMLLIVFNYASFRSPEYLLPFSAVTGYKGLSNWLVCLRGCYSIRQQARSHVLTGPLGFLVPQEDWMTAIPPSDAPPSKDDQSLQYMVDNLFDLPYVKISTSIEALDAYTDALIRLRQLLYASSRTTDLFSRRGISSAWPATISETFLWLLNEHKPPALLIMGHYCLLLKKCEAYWDMEHRAHDLFQAVQQSLAEEWYPYLEYPMQVFKECT